jgi:hypothetical protein
MRQNALALKAIWVDIDVKEGPKHYNTIAEAWETICKFRVDAGLPMFSAVVSSGGGLHVYWISKTAMSSDEWRPYAEGLKALLLQHGIKCDAGLTTDNVRILRIPNTLNHKYDPPRPVELLDLPARDYDFDPTLTFLTALAPVRAPGVAAPNSFFDAAAFAGKVPILTATDKLSDGIEPRNVLLDPTPIFRKCGFLQDALLNGGKTYDNPLWNLTTLCATFMENGNELAHEMSKGHASYTFAETQSQYERKVADRQSRGLGYPSCATIQGNGSSACATCPLLKIGKSPLNIRPDGFTAKVTGRAAASVIADTGLMLPRGYTLGTDGCIYRIIERETNGKGEPVEPMMLQLFYSRLSAPWAQADPDAINFQTTTDKGNVRQASVKMTDIPGMNLFTVLAHNKVKYHADGKRFVEGFLMAWLDRLHEAQAAAISLPFGWVGPAGAHTGFVFGGTNFHTDGKQSPSGAGDGKMREWYKPTGELKPWLTACKMITDMKRPELDAIIALSFAAPLMVFGGEYSALLSAWSSESGSQKSSALKVGLAVWGHPKKTKEVTKTTAVSVLLKLGEIKSLPLYWDEITSEDAQKNLRKVMFTSSDGVDGGRGTPSLAQQSKGDWQLAMCCCANLSFVDHLVKEMPTTPAGLYRVFEYAVKKSPPTGTGMIDSTDASRTLQNLEGNYGIMGLAYAKLLADNATKLNQSTRDTIVQVGLDLGGNPEERYWKVLVGTLIVGATLANELGATLDVLALKTWLYATYKTNRERVLTECLVGGSHDNTEEMLTSYLKDRTDQSIWTDGFPTGMGRKRGVNIKRGPRQDSNVLKGIQVRWDVGDNMLRISKVDFSRWLQFRNVGVSSMTRGLRDNFGMTMDKRVLCAGTTHAVMQENVMSIPVKGGSAMEDVMKLWSQPDDPVAAAAQPAPSEGEAA